MRRLARSLLATVAAVSLAVAMLTAATVACPEDTAVASTAQVPASHDCDAPAPTAPESSHHDACMTMVGCGVVSLGDAATVLASLDALSSSPAIRREPTPPSAIDRAPVAPPPRG